MNEKHRDRLEQYVNDMIGLERDIATVNKGAITGTQAATRIRELWKNH